jgi:hypothetical protein
MGKPAAQIDFLDVDDAIVGDRRQVENQSAAVQTQRVVAGAADQSASAGEIDIGNGQNIIALAANEHIVATVADQ